MSKAPILRKSQRKRAKNLAKNWKEYSKYSQETQDLMKLRELYEAKPNKPKHYPASTKGRTSSDLPPGNVAGIKFNYKKLQSLNESDQAPSEIRKHASFQLDQTTPHLPKYFYRRGIGSQDKNGSDLVFEAASASMKNSFSRDPSKIEITPERIQKMKSKLVLNKQMMDQSSTVSSRIKQFLGGWSSIDTRLKGKDEKMEYQRKMWEMLNHSNKMMMLSKQRTRRMESTGNNKNFGGSGASGSPQRSPDVAGKAPRVPRLEPEGLLTRGFQLTLNGGKRDGSPVNVSLSSTETLRERNTLGKQVKREILNLAQISKVPFFKKMKMLKIYQDSQDRSREVIEVKGTNNFRSTRPRPKPVALKRKAIRESESMDQLNKSSQKKEQDKALNSEKDDSEKKEKAKQFKSMKVRLGLKSFRKRAKRLSADRAEDQRRHCSPVRPPHLKLKQAKKSRDYIREQKNIMRVRDIFQKFKEEEESKKTKRKGAQPIVYEYKVYNPKTPQMSPRGSLDGSNGFVYRAKKSKRMLRNISKGVASKKTKSVKKTKNKGFGGSGKGRKRGDDYGDLGAWNTGPQALPDFMQF